MSYFLDLFIGNPATSGVSVLATITGSATRLDVSDSMETARYPAVALTNPDTIVISTGSLAVTNISWVALYATASGGAPLFSAPIGASPTINLGNPVRFNALALNFQATDQELASTLSLHLSLSATLTLRAYVIMASESGVEMISEAGAVMITELLVI